MGTKNSQGSSGGKQVNDCAGDNRNAEIRTIKRLGKTGDSGGWYRAYCACPAREKSKILYSISPGKQWLHLPLE